MANPALPLLVFGIKLLRKDTSFLYSSTTLSGKIDKIRNNKKFKKGIKKQHFKQLKKHKEQKSLITEVTKDQTAVEVMIQEGVIIEIIHQGHLTQAGQILQDHQEVLLIIAQVHHLGVVVVGEEIKI